MATGGTALGFLAARVPQGSPQRGFSGNKRQLWRESLVPSGGDKLLLALSSPDESLDEAALEDTLQLQGCCCCCCPLLSWPSWFLSSRITDPF